MTENIALYGERWPQFKLKVNIFFSELKSAGKKIALYGAGNRTAAFINFNNILQYIDLVVDDQIEKQTLFMPGSYLQILPSEQLEEQNVDIIFMAVNTECEVRVMNKHASLLKKGVIFYSILPPSDFLPSFWKDFKEIENYV
ncbi:MAG: hypothetical protein NTZ67_08655 [Gammaproteobacteria bacterium]|nr:hypothetical protein [Gammaproteobacteria bacterium]